MRRDLQAGPPVGFAGLPDRLRGAFECGHFTATAAGDEIAFVESLSAAVASSAPDFIATLLGQLRRATRPAGAADSDDAGRLNAGLAILAAIGPRDEMEAAFGAQMVATHFLGMEALRLAVSQADLDGLERYAAVATKLQRTAVAQVEALAKLRGGGQQRVTVIHEHRHTYVDNRGGNAVVGDVHGGSADGNGEQPHDPRALGVQARGALPSEDPGWHAMSARTTARPDEVQAPRRGLARRAQGAG